jgi:ubiquinone/menaquinone biosynthesis C-methylase UbiE
MVDVFHHLERPAACLKEVHRVLKDNGSLIIVEPDISLLGWVIYGLCHKEPVGYLEKISTNPAPPTAETYYARQSSAHRVFLKKQYSELLKPLKIKEVTRLPMLYYILTGGFSGPNLAKFIKKGWVTCLENALKNFPQVSSTRLLTVLEKPSGHLNK